MFAVPYILSSSGPSLLYARSSHFLYVTDTIVHLTNKHLIVLNIGLLSRVIINQYPILLQIMKYLITAVAAVVATSSVVSGMEAPELRGPVLVRLLYYGLMVELSLQ